jgi:Secretion system C-terminal sorting domain
MPFPMTSASKQNYASGRNVVNFTLNVPAFALNYVPCQMVYREYRKDSVVGYGTMRVYTPNGASAPYDVLMNKVTTYSVDSFYVGGAPAPPAIQNAFGIAQGQKTGVRNFYNFMRKGNYNYIARAYYATDTTFTTLDIGFTCADNVAPTSITENTTNQFSTFAYPNPSTQADVHLKLLGSTFAKFKHYTITNQVGATVHTEKINNTADELILPTSNFAKGTYFVTLQDNEGTIINEKIMVN